MLLYLCLNREILDREVLYYLLVPRTPASVDLFESASTEGNISLVVCREPGSREWLSRPQVVEVDVPQKLAVLGTDCLRYSAEY